MEIGSRVGAIKKADEGSVHFYGFGVYEGDFPKAVFGDDGFKIPNPRIRLDTGGEVWGCECWWGPEEKIKKMMYGKQIIHVAIAP